MEEESGVATMRRVHLAGHAMVKETGALGESMAKRQGWNANEKASVAL